MRRSPRKEETKSMNTMERHKILVVDDEEDLCEILQFNLESEGFAVDVANSAEDALKILDKSHELILLDVMMEGMSGFKMAEKVRKDLHLDTPIIFLTAKDTENDMLTGFSIGGDDYISKPFSIKEVSARVKAVLKRSGKQELPAQQQVIEIGDLSIDPIGKNVTLKGHAVLLTKKEMANNTSPTVRGMVIVWNFKSFILLCISLTKRKFSCTSYWYSPSLP